MQSQKSRHMMQKLLSHLGSSLDGFYDCFYFVINSISFGIINLIEKIAKNVVGEIKSEK